MHGQSFSQVRERQSLRGLGIGQSALPKICASTGSDQSLGDVALVARHVVFPSPAGPIGLGQLQLSLSVYDSKVY